MLRQRGGFSSGRIDDPDLGAPAAIRQKGEPAVGSPLGSAIGFPAVRERDRPGSVGADEPDVGLVAAAREIRLEHDERDAPAVGREARLRERLHRHDVLDRHRAGSGGGEGREENQREKAGGFHGRSGRTRG